VAVDPGGMMGPGMGIVMMLFWLVVVGLAVTGVVMLVRRLSNGVHRRRHPDENDEALDTARERFARGEISRSEFETTKKTLKED
jgi:putative membrane protein